MILDLAPQTTAWTDQWLVFSPLLTGLIPSLYIGEFLYGTVVLAAGKIFELRGLSL